ncbi:MAG: SDR family oxidoreductase [Elusimicrobia bacterium]|nr:SDR family oxidoreductase [Elusimicrobiota bacterium]
MVRKNKTPDHFRLDGRVALVTGAAGHLGRAIAAALCQAGAEVILNGRDRDALEAAAKTLRARGGKASVSAWDVSRPRGVEGLLKDVRERHGRLDVLVNNAYSGGPGRFERTDWDDFRKAYEVSVQASFLLTQKALPLLAKAAKSARGGASVINIASMYGLVSPDPAIYGRSGFDNPPSYGAAKAALIQLTRYAACHLGPRKIRVNSVSPGPFPPAALARAQPKFFKELCRKNPLGRIGLAEEIAGPVLFLACDASSYVTGANLTVDGGWTAW